MTLTKKESAQLLYDALESEKMLPKKVVLVILQALIIAAIVTYLTSWYFGLAILLVCGLLGQFAHERMTNSITSRKLTAIKSLRWKESDLDGDDLNNKLNLILNKESKNDD